MSDQLDLWSVASKHPSSKSTNREIKTAGRKPTVATDVERLAQLREQRRRDPNNDALRFQCAHLASRLE